MVSLPVSIYDRVVIGAGVVVTEDIVEPAVYAGNPCALPERCAVSPERCAAIATKTGREEHERKVFHAQRCEKTPRFSRQRFVAKLRPTAHLSGNAPALCNMIRKAENSGEALYGNNLDGNKLSSDVRQTFVASAANHRGKAQSYASSALSLPSTPQGALSDANSFAKEEG